MSTIDVTALLEPVSEDAPCGENLEEAPEFGELDRSAQGKPGHVMGDKEIPAEPPRWPDVAELALPLAARSKDLRVAAHLTNAALRIDGVQGLADGLALIHGMVEQYWTDVFPLLDAEDNDDPWERVNALSALNDRGDNIEGLASGVVAGVETAILVNSKMAGRFSLRDIRLASGEISLPEGDETPVPTLGLIDGAFQDCDLDELTATSAAVDSCVERLAALDAYMKEQVGTSVAPDFDLLRDKLKTVRQHLHQHLATRGVGIPEDQGDDQDGSEATDAPGPQAISGDIQSREDVIRMLDKMCEYFARNEPSSPVPMLLLRAKRLISKDFMEILKDLTPDAVEQAQLIGGIESED